MKPIKIGKYTVTWRFILILAVALAIIYLRLSAGGDTPGVEDTFSLLGLK